MTKSVPDRALFDGPVADATAFFEDASFPRFRASQMTSWLFDGLQLTPEGWSNIPQSQRNEMAVLVGASSINSLTEARSKDGLTRKYALHLQAGGVIEAVLMLSEDGAATVCLSSQVGCAMGCDFCRTATMGLVRNLTPTEIVWQWLHVAAALGRKPDRIVMMGMGEPLHNVEALLTVLQWLTSEQGAALSPRRITVSTVGLLAPLKKLMDAYQVNVAVSLNASHSEQRQSFMPVERKHKLSEIVSLLKREAGGRRKVTAEYVLLADANDTDADAKRLISLFGGSRVRINLIPFNEYPGAGYSRPGHSRIRTFHAMLQNAGLNAHIRWSKGDDVMGACGQLATKTMEDAA